MDYMNSFMSLCRLCLKPNQGEVSIFQDDKIENSDLYHKITICLPIKISINDDLPKKICYSCSKNVDFVYNFWQLSCNSEKQLQNMLDNVKEFIVQNSDIEIQPENADIIYDTLSVKDMKDWKCLEDDVNDSNIVIQEVDVCDYDEEIVSHIVNENVLPVEESADELILNATDSHPLEVQPPAEDTQISQIVESSNVSLREWMAKNEDTDMSTEKFLDMILVKADPKIETSPYICTKCGEDCVNEEKLADHALVEHRSYKCLFCNKIFAQKYSLENHLYVHTDTRKHPCSQCSLSFKREIDLYNHVKRTHAKTEIVIYHCDKCDYTSKTRFGIKIHLLAHDGISIYNCDECGKGFNSKMDLRTHKNNHIGFKPFQCDICGNSFTRGPYLKQHRYLVHENPHSFKCDICKRTFSLKSTLKNHLKMHTGENRNYTCDICGKTVSSKISLMNHQRIHTGDKRFACNICGKAYVTKLQVNRHAYVHTGNKPFKCDVCSKSLATGSSLIKHMQTHWENRILYSCSVCNKSYISKYKLRSHILTNHEGQFVI